MVSKSEKGSPEKQNKNKIPKPDPLLGPRSKQPKAPKIHIHSSQISLLYCMFLKAKPFTLELKHTQTHAHHIDWKFKISKNL